MLAVLLATTALADTSSINSTTSMGVLENDYVRAGVNSDKGTFGSGGSATPGLLFDSTGTGTFDTSYDYLTPGTPFDGFAVKVDSTNYTNNNAGAAGIAKSSENLVDGENTLTWNGEMYSGTDMIFLIENTYTLAPAAPYIDITTQITMGRDATNLSFGRFIDPDARAAAGDSSATDNVLGYGSIPNTNVAFSEATVSRYALGIYSTDSNVDAGITRWTTEADSYTENSVDGDGSNTNTGDNTIGLSWMFGSVSTGDILTANYAYIFGPSAFDAANEAVTGGAGGGADVTGGAGVTDVGSATDAATSGGSTPTITGSTSVDVVTVTEATSTTLPVLTASITSHTSSVADGVQTIARETTTTVTTPVDVTTTTVTRTTDTYSDGSTVVTDGAPSIVTVVRNDAVVTVTDPGDFVARMDQGTVLESAVDVRGLGFADGVSTGRLNSDAGNSSVYSLGTSVLTDNGLIVAGGLNKISTSNNSGNMNTTHFGIEVGKSLDLFTIRGSVNNASSDVSYSRTIGSFSNQGSYSITDRWIDLEIEPNTGTIRPVVGATVGNKTTDAYTETGSVQSKIINPEGSETYKYATIGVNIDLPIGIASISRTTEGTTRLGVGIDYNVKNNINVVADLNRTINDNTSITGISAGISIDF